jgi:hypothetical protein
MKDWKTTSAGISLIVAAIVGVIFAPVIDATVITIATTGLLGGIGLLFSKDATE